MGIGWGILIRHALTYVGGAAAWVGSIDGSDIQLVAGVISTAVGVVLSYVNKVTTKVVS